MLGPKELVTHQEDAVMPASQHIPDRNSQHLHVRARSAPLCYSRQATSDVIHQARIDTQSNAVLALSVVTFVAAFLVVYGGWGF